MQKLSFGIRGVPENWMNTQGNKHSAFFAQRRRFYKWRETVAILGSAAREHAGWPRAEMDSPRRRIQIHQIRHGELDIDGLWTSSKPVIDGLKAWLYYKYTESGNFISEMGKQEGPALIYDDGAKYCEMLPATQEVTRLKEMLTIVTVEIIEP